MSTQHTFELIIVYHPLPDMMLEGFIARMRRQDSASSRPRLLVLTEDARLEEARRHARRGPSVVLSVDETRTLVEVVESHLLGVAPRVATRLPIRLDVQLQDGTAVVMAQSEDLSRTGMLVRTDRFYPLGTMVTFEALLPGDPRPVQGEAEVVHHTLVGMERAPSLGLRFLFLKNEGLRRLLVFVSRQIPSW
jgi:hypothetical protein